MTPERLVRQTSRRLHDNSPTVICTIPYNFTYLDASTCPDRASRDPNLREYIIGG